MVCEKRFEAPAQDGDPCSETSSNHFQNFIFENLVRGNDLVSSNS